MIYIFLWHHKLGCYTTLLGVRGQNLLSMKKS